MSRNDIVGIDIACHVREAIKDLPCEVPGPSISEIGTRVANAVRAVLEQAQRETGVQGGMDDADVIALLKEARGKGMDLREHDDFPFRLAARHGRLEVMKFLHGDKSTRPSKESLLFALIDALDSGHLDAARFLGKLVLSGIPSLMRNADRMRADLESANERIRALAMEIDMREEIGARLAGKGENE